MNDIEIEKAQNTPPPQRPFTFEDKTGEQLFLEDLNPRHCYIWRSLFRREFLTGNQLTFIPEFYFQDVPFLHKCYLMANRCLRTPWQMTIYRKGHESATYSFDLRKVKILSIAIAKTWELTRLDGLSLKVQDKLREDVYTSFSLMVWITVHKLDKTSDRIEAIDFMKRQAPDLWFKNGAKQKLESYLYRYLPHLYIHLWYIYTVICRK